MVVFKIKLSEVIRLAMQQNRNDIVDILFMNMLKKTESDHYYPRFSVEKIKFRSLLDDIYNELEGENTNIYSTIDNICTHKYCVELFLYIYNVNNPNIAALKLFKNNSAIYYSDSYEKISTILN